MCEFSSIRALGLEEPGRWTCSVAFNTVLSGSRGAHTFLSPNQLGGDHNHPWEEFIHGSLHSWSPNRVMLCGLQQVAEEVDAMSDKTANSSSQHRSTQSKATVSDMESRCAGGRYHRQSLPSRGGMP